MKYLLFAFLPILILFSCDNIDDLNLIAGLGYFEMEITSPLENDSYEEGGDCIIRWILPRKRAKNVKLELIKKNNVIYTISPSTENDHEYLWKNIGVETCDGYRIRISILDGVYTSRSRDGNLFKVCIAEDKIVRFEDYNLEKAIREILKKPEGYILKDDVKGIMSLNLDSKQISSIKGLEHFVSLRDLTLRNNNIKIITPLERLYNLYYLELGNNEIVDINPLSKLTSLAFLHLNNNEIEDISPLSGLSNLEVLNLVHNKINIIPCMPGLVSLTRFYLKVNLIQDIPLLEELISLRYIDIELNPLNMTDEEIKEQFKDREIFVCL